MLEEGVKFEHPNKKEEVISVVINWFSSPAFLRLFHASPDAPAVDVYANNRKIASSLAFKNLTDYLRLRPGRYNIEVYPAGERRNPVLRKNIVVRRGSISTAAVIGSLDNLSLFVIEDPDETPRKDTAYIRAAHLSPDAPAGDVKVDDRTLFRNIRYQNATRYVSVKPGTYNLSIYRTGTNNKVLEIPNVVLQPEFYYTTAVLGLVNEEPPLQGATFIDGLYKFIS